MPNDGVTRERYLPINDLLFKRVLGNKAHPEVTRGFIEAVTGLQAGEVVVDNPYSVEWARGLVGQLRLAETAVDVSVEVSGYGWVIVEMQAAKQPHFLKRQAYYAASRFAGQYEPGRGAGYAALRPVWSV